MDLILPNLDGIDAIKTIKEETPDVKIIIITAISTKSKLYKGLEVGAADYIVKPLNAAAVTKVFDKISPQRP